MFIKHIWQALLITVLFKRSNTCNAFPQGDAPAPSPNESIDQYISTIENVPDLASDTDPDAAFLITSSEFVDDSFLDDAGIVLAPITALDIGGSNYTHINLTDSGALSNVPGLTSAQLTSRRRSAAKYRRQGSFAQDIWVAFKNTTTGGGYNLTLPAGLCTTSVIQPYIDPRTNNVVTGGTLGQFWYAFNQAEKTDDEWRTFLRTQIQNSLDTIMSQADTGDCAPDLKLKEKRAAGTLSRSERKDLILYERMPQRSRYALGTGWWTATFLATIPGFGMTFGALGATLSAAAQHRIGPWKEALLITIIGFVTAVFSNFMYRLDIQAAFGRFEVKLVALFSCIGAAIAQSLGKCFDRRAVSRAIEAYQQRYRQRGSTPPPIDQAAIPGAPAGGEVEMQQMC